MNCSITQAETEKTWKKDREWEEETKEEREREWEREVEKYRSWGIERTTEKVITPTLEQTRTQSYTSATALGLNAMNSFKSIKDINPKVIQDLTDIFEKFPCNKWVSIPLERTVSIE